MLIKYCQCVLVLPWWRVCPIVCIWIVSNWRSGTLPIRLVYTTKGEGFWVCFMALRGWIQYDYKKYIYRADWYIRILKSIVLNGYVDDKCRKEIGWGKTNTACNNLSLWMPRFDRVKLKAGQEWDIQIIGDGNWFPRKISGRIIDSFMSVPKVE
jgi:hypothetical protein